MAYLHPGVYVEEIPSGAKPIEGVATSIAAFVGPANRGPANEALLIHSFDDYVATYGQISSTKDSMSLAVSAFYMNGGKDAYIARIVNSNPPAAASNLSFAGEGTGGAAVLKVQAASVGEWGNDLLVRILKKNAVDLTFKLEIGRLGTAGDTQNKFIADEEYSGLTMVADSDQYVLKRVNDESRLVSISLEPKADPGNVNNAYVKATLTGAATDGAGTAFSNNLNGVVDAMTMSLNLDGLGSRKITLGTKASLNLIGDNRADGGVLAQAIAAEVAKYGPRDSYSRFACTYDHVNTKFVLTSGVKSPDSAVVVYDGDGSRTDLAKFIKIDSGSNPTSVHGVADVTPKEDKGPMDRGRPLQGGAGAPPSAEQYKSFFSKTLVKVRDASIVLLPGMDVSNNKAVIDEAVAHCEATGNRMVILDPPPGQEFDQTQRVKDLNLTTSSYAVMYYPWVRVANPLYNAETNSNVAKTILVGPSAFAAGMWSKIDGRRGVWKAPAGVETALLGVQGLQYLIEDGEQDQLNPLGVNCLRKLPSYGAVIWGSRTLSTKANPEWRYVPVRRTAIMIEQSVYDGIQWAVFEPNDHRLWSSLRLNIDSFMNGLFRAGAFQGEKASDAYFVRCGLGDTMTQADIDRGQVIVTIGFAPLKPAEFVIVRIQQKAGQQ